MTAANATVADRLAVGWFPLHKERLASPSHDGRATRRRAIAVTAALLLHTWVILFLLVDRDKDEEPTPPTMLPVEIVFPTKPKAVAVPPPQSLPSPPPAPSVQASRASGSEQPEPTGHTEAPPQPTPAPKTEPAATEKPGPKAKAVTTSEPAPQSSEEAPAPSPQGAQAVAVPVQAPQAADDQALAALPPVPVMKPDVPPHPPAPSSATSRHPAAEARVESAALGQGGGDPYLNAVRTDILRNRVYPSAARAQGLNGTAQYAILVNRQGSLLRVRVLRSSGADLLDKAGVEAIERSAPFKPLPPDVMGEVVDLVVTLHMGP
jgi:protein TonB